MAERNNLIFDKTLLAFSEKEVEDLCFALFDVTDSPAQEEAVIKECVNLKDGCDAVIVLESAQRILLARLLERRSYLLKK